MAKHSFTPFQRYAVYTVHGEKCYLCSKPIDLKTMEVDHIIPEQLLDEPDSLMSVLQDFKLPEDFDLNSYHNWLPACRPCNNEKSNLVFKPAPIILTRLQHAATKAGKAAQLERETITTQKLSRALNMLERAKETEELESELIELLVAFHEKNRTPEVLGDPIRLTPLYEVLSEENGIRVVRGPHGVGGGPVNPNSQGGFVCPTCGHSAWNGTHCVICGEMSDD